MDTPVDIPVRVLIEGNLHLPEDAFRYSRDVKTARVYCVEDGARQVRAWLEEVADV